MVQTPLNETHPRSKAVTPRATKHPSLLRRPTPVAPTVEPETESTAVVPPSAPQPVAPAVRSTSQVLRIFSLLVTDIGACVAWAALEPDNVAVPIAMAIGIVASYAWAGLYRRRITELLLDDLPQLFQGMLVGLGFVAVAMLVGPSMRTLPTFGWILLVAVTVMLGRAFTYARHRRGTRHGRETVRVLVLGTGQSALDLARRSAHHPNHGATLVGFVGDRAGIPPTVPLPWLGGYDDLLEVIERLDIDVITVAFPSLDEQALARLLRHEVPGGVIVYSLPNGYDISRNTGRLGDRLLGTPLVRLGPRHSAPTQLRAKRALDIVLSLIGCVVAAPVMLLVALAVRIELGPGVIFRQERIGQYGQTFTLMKFRSMHPVKDGDSQTRWSIAGETRLGPVGRTIRSTSLDELPQLFNVLRGDMSFVGPRPERPYFVHKYTQLFPDYADRHRSPAGLTGHAAINGLRGDTDISERVRYDNAYIDNWSIWRDLKIILRTVNSVFRRHGS